MKNTILCSALLIGLLVGSSSAADEDKKKSKAEQRLAKIEAKYQPTGKNKSCVSLRFLRESNIVDDMTIFFRGPGKKAYINRLPRRCPRLSYEQRFAYSVSTGQLCKSDIITVLDSLGAAWNSCGLGQFEEWEKKPKAEKPQSE